MASDFSSKPNTPAHPRTGKPITGETAIVRSIDSHKHSLDGSDSAESRRNVYRDS